MRPLFGRLPIRSQFLVLALAAGTPPAGIAWALRPSQRPEPRTELPGER